MSSTVGIETIGNRYRLRLPRLVTNSSISRYISTGLEATPENHRIAQTAAWEIEADIKADRLADTYSGYVDRFKPRVLLVAPKPQQYNLSDLWVKYCDYKRPQLAITTYKSDYCMKWANHIAKLPQRLDRAVELRDTLVATTSIDTAKRLLTALSAMGKWAVKSQLLATNPFDGMAADLKRPKTDRTISPFTRSERDAILDAFAAHHPHYHPFVQFLFLTGCRTGEAIGLQWQHIRPDLSSVTFSESYSGKLKIHKTTKTGKTRTFPCNPDLMALLTQIKPAAAKPTDLVFTSPTGLPIDNCRFTSRVWKGGCYAGNCYRGIVPKLVEEGLVEAYRSPYNTRHTFITLMLQAGLTIPQVASLVGNSPEIVLKHYAGSAVDAVPRV